MSDVTRILSAIEQGDQKSGEQLLPGVYEERRKLVRHIGSLVTPFTRALAGNMS